MNEIIPHYIYDDWNHWKGRQELIDGHPIAMSPSLIPTHQRVASEMRTELILALRKSKCKYCRVYHPIDYKIAEDTILEHDILIVCGDITKSYLDFVPALVVEILSPSTALRDRYTKYELYEQQGVLYYLIVDIEQKKLEVYNLVNQKYQRQPDTSSFTFQLSDNCSITPDFSNIFT